MFYMAISPEDDKIHQKWHDTVKKLWKGVKIVYEATAKGALQKVIVASSEDPQYKKRTKVSQIRKMVDAALNYRQSDQTPTEEKTYIYISNSKVIGCIVAESIDKAYRVVANNNQENNITPSISNSITCSKNQPQHAVLGISRIWIWKEVQRQGLATKLLDIVRNTFFFGDKVEKDLIAITQPSSEGYNFAVKYFGRKDFLVYLV
eukprot:TRINITY_DN1591_c0_g1_i1.p1 TRINITY_DN1591_c0_g1~~TRINITY_DN1591_c0_g1_i1.p1  ORF type:complete len:237 (-),score=36.57 TRINITY_DN1591_c0_g1_i1:12-626(-)